jgi:hypothetical protein
MPVFDVTVTKSIGVRFLVTADTKQEAETIVRLKLADDSEEDVTKLDWQETHSQTKLKVYAIYEGPILHAK